MSGGASNALSCRNCREKKIKCNKITPRCNKCQQSGADCVYPSRRPRAKRVRPVTVAVTEETLRDILMRLERLERAQNISALTISTSPPATHESEQSSSEDEEDPSAASLSHLVSEATTAARAILDEPIEDSAQQVQNSNVLETLNTVVEGVRVFKMREGTHTRVTEDVAFPKERVKKWIRGFFESPFPIPIPTSLMNREFMLLIPDLLDNPHVKIDNTSMICYYNAVYQGMMVDETHPFPERGRYSKFLYHTTLSLVETWQMEKKDSATIMDFAAAYMVVWMTSEFLDSNLSWKLFCRACNIGRRIGLFDLDRPTPDSSTPTPLIPEEELQKDHKRALFWQVLQVDCMFRQHYSRPAVVKSGSWAVNFPDLVMGTHTPHSLSPVQIIFIVNSKLTIATTKFLDNPQNVSAAAAAALSAEIDEILSSWQISRRFRAATTPMEKWIFADLLFNANTTLVLLTRLSFPPSPRALQAARASVCLVQEMSAAYPNHAHWNMGFVSYYPFVSFFTLFYSIIAGGERAREDLTLTLWLGEVLATWKNDREELRPFEAVAKALNCVAQHIVTVKSPRPIAAAVEGQRQLELMPEATPGWTGVGVGGGVGGGVGLGIGLGMGPPTMWAGTGNAIPREGGGGGGGDETSIDLEEFLASPMEYARLLESGIFKNDPHAEWWECVE